MRETGGRKGERGEEWNGMGGVRDGRIWEVEKEKEVVEGESIKNCKAGEQLKNEEGSLGVHCRGCTCTVLTNKKPVSKIRRC